MINTVDTVNRLIVEGKSDYEIYHSSYTSSVQEIERFVKKNGYTFGETKEEADEQLFNVIGTGPPKPSKGKTNKIDLELWKGKKKQKKLLHAQVYNRGTSGNTFELNMYIS